MYISGFTTCILFHRFSAVTILYTASFLLDITLILSSLTFWLAYSRFYAGSLVTVKSLLLTDSYCSLILLLWIARVVCTQSMETWGIWYIEEGFFVWIIPSRYQTNESIYWARTTGFVISVCHIIWCLIHVRVCMLTMWFSMHAFDSDLLIHACLFLHATWHSSPTYWGVLTPLDLHVQISEFGACGFSPLLIRDAQRKRGS